MNSGVIAQENELPLLTIAARRRVAGEHLATDPNQHQGDRADAEFRRRCMNCGASLAAFTVTAACPAAAVSSELGAMTRTPIAPVRTFNAAVFIKDGDTALKRVS